MDQIFKALSDPTRRALLDALRSEDGQSLTQLEARLEMTRFGVMKHLGVLEAANLVVTKKVGRFKYHYLNAQPLQEVIDRWIEPLLARPIARGMTDLKTQLEGHQAMDNSSTTKPDFMMQTFIRTTQDRLWDALTTPDQIAAYHFAADTARAHESGGHEMFRKDGSLMLRMVLIREEPKSRLEFSFEPLWSGDAPEPSRAVFIIEAQGDVCKLTCEHYDVTPALEGVREGWARQVASLKSWLETGQPIKADMAAAA
ncbi:MAG: metalloregulator ArsR/SmtB family transcription factor [Paracoccaceae bacterium]